MRFALECLERLFNISLAAYGQSDQLYLQELRAVFRRLQIPKIRRLGMQHEPDALDPRCNLAELF
jgi:hypothetical protein